MKSAIKKRLSIWRERKQPKRANRRVVFDRLLGIETEYGLLRSSRNDSTNDILELYHELVSWLGNRVASASSIQDPFSTFLANGSRISVETTLDSLRNAAQSEKQLGIDKRQGCSGFIELATPECRSPHELIAYQHVQDAWMASALDALHPREDCKWIKNSSDAYGTQYGQHENYEVSIVDSWRAVMWRIGLIMLIPMLGGYRILSFLSTWSIIELFKLRSKAKKWWSGFWKRDNDSSKQHYYLPTSPLSRNAEFEFLQGLSPKLLGYLAKGLRVLHAPIACYFLLLIRLCVLVPQRRFLAGFFASRCIIEGSGFVDRRGGFWMTARGSSIDCEIGFGRYWGERPIYLVGHWLQAILSDRTWSFRACRDLFRVRQRIQIAIGDSTPNDRSQWLRLASTSLVFDCLELSDTRRLPRIPRIVKSLKLLASDCSLMRTVNDRRGLVWSAIDLQRQYISAVRAMLSELPQGSTSSQMEEARNCLVAWNETLDHLQESETEPRSQRWLLGRVDWFSKRWLIDRSMKAGKRKTKFESEHHASETDESGRASELHSTTKRKPKRSKSPVAYWNRLKRIDIKFHELDSQGLYSQLVRALDVPAVLNSEQIDRAMRLPPQDSPAMKRCYMIREFAEFYDDFAIDWREAAWTDEDGKRQTSSW